MSRCLWATTPLSMEYHDTEWGVPVHDDRTFFEFITLEGAQAGLSWETILRKRPRYREVFYDFHPDRVARMADAQIARALADAGIVRHRQKVESTVANARAFRGIQREFGTFDRYVWPFCGGNPIVTRPQCASEIPSLTVEAVALSADLKRRGFSFVGPTIVYAFMQATGLVDDHLATCFRSCS
ncbi:MAG: DNA-3-methyladenine glycosylase I [Candidatus Eremiobacteraeota bacterium]|nr:DNA-3-methyladenine glycosylase I [Candidatus Eremiobacteraeota bacterium]